MHWPKVIKEPEIDLRNSSYNSALFKNIDTVVQAIDSIFAFVYNYEATYQINYNEKIIFQDWIIVTYD